MPEIMNPDGTWTTLTKAEYIERFGEDDWRALTMPPIPESEMTEFQQYMSDKMQVEAEASAALRAAGIESLDDLPVEGDDASISLDDLVPQEYDYEGALEDLEANHPERLRPLEPDTDQT